MKAQAQKYGAAIENERVTRLDRVDGGFSAAWGSGSATARTVLLATGTTNRRPPMDEGLHDEALARGLIRYCPICDGYEVTDKKLGVIGSGAHGVAEAVFLRSYTADITLIAPDRAHDVAAEDQAKLARARHRARSTGPATRSRRWTTRSSSRRRTAITRSTASIRRWAPTCTPSSPARSGWR